jgi:hypothetical protein
MSNEAQWMIGIGVPILSALLAWIIKLNNKATDTNSRTRGLQKQMDEVKTDLGKREAEIEAQRAKSDACREGILTQLAGLGSDIKLILQELRLRNGTAGDNWGAPTSERKED